MDVLYLYYVECAFFAWAEKCSLTLLELAFVYDTTQDQVVLALVEGLLNMELTAISLVLEGGEVRLPLAC